MSIDLTKEGLRLSVREGDPGFIPEMRKIILGYDLLVDGEKAVTVFTCVTGPNGWVEEYATDEHGEIVIDATTKEPVTRRRENVRVELTPRKS